MRTVLVLLAAACVAGCSAKAAPQVSSGPSAVGRYTIIHSPQLERDTFLLDTATGNSWQLTESKEGTLVWQASSRTN